MLGLLLSAAAQADATSFFSDDIFDFFEQQAKAVADLADKMEKRYKARREAHQSSSQISLHEFVNDTASGMELIIKGKEAETVDVQYDDNTLFVRLDDLSIALRIHGRQLVLSAREAIKSEAKDGDNACVYSSTKSFQEVAPLTQMLELEKATPKYNKTEKEFVLTIPYKANKKISVEIVE